MGSLVKLALDLGDGRSMVHKYYRHLDQPDGLLVTLPGNHYGMDGPLLYYTSEMMWSKGWDTLALMYGYQTAGETFTLDKIPLACEQIRAAIGFVLEQRAYLDLVLVGKSLGAAIVAQLCIQDGPLSGARAAFLTPPLGMPEMAQFLENDGPPCYLAIGTNDRFYSEDSIENLGGGRAIHKLVINGADHSMDFEEDLPASLDAVQKVVSDLVAFIEREG